MRAAAMALGIVAAAALASCASEPTRFYQLRGPDSFYGPEQAGAARAWMAKHGIYDSISYQDHKVTFKYGSDELRTMNDADFEALVRNHIAGQTVFSATRPNLRSAEGIANGTITYFGDDGRFADWAKGAATAVRGKWWFEAVPPGEAAKGAKLGVALPPRVLCTQVDGSTQLPLCREEYDYLLGSYGRRAGDVFNLMSGKAPAALGPATPSTWPDGSPLITDEAFHD